MKIIEFLEGRKEEDVFPVCYRINTTKKIKKTAAITGFEVKEVNVVNSSPTTVSLGAFVIVELLVIKLLSLAILKEMRSNIIAILRKKNY